MERNKTYSWFVNAVSDCGSSTSEVRTLTIGNGIVFTNHNQNITINRDYDQRISVAVKNEDSVAHTLTSSVLNPYEDLIINFINSGSIDETITLQPGETVNLTLAIHAQDADLSNYSLTANLIADEDGTPIVDNANLNINVLSAGDFSIVEDLSAFDEVTLARTYVITNHGQVITDLSLEAVDPETGKPASIYLTPSLDHARLGTGESIRVVAYPIFTEDDVSETQASILSGIQMVSLKEDSTVSAKDFTLQAAGGGNTVELSGSTSCGSGKQIYAVTINDCAMSFDTEDWYCTNRPQISTPINVPAFLTENVISNISLSMTFTPQSAARSHAGQLYFNGTEIVSFEDLLPDGSYSFEVARDLWNEGIAGLTTQNVQLESQHPNGGHYVSATGYSLNVDVDNATTYACAASQESAEQVIRPDLRLRCDHRI